MKDGGLEKEAFRTHDENALKVDTNSAELAWQLRLLSREDRVGFNMSFYL